MYIDKKREELLFCYSPKLLADLTKAGCKVLDIRVNKKNDRVYWLFEKTDKTEEVMKNFGKEEKDGRK